MTNTLVEFSAETIYYEAFQTDIDNYRIEINSKDGITVEHLFNYYINDGIFTPSTLQASIKGDTVYIGSKYAIGNGKAQTKHGKFVVMKRM